MKARTSTAAKVCLQLRRDTNVAIVVAEDIFFRSAYRKQRKLSHVYWKRAMGFHFPICKRPIVGGNFLKERPSTNHKPFPGCLNYIYYGLHATSAEHDISSINAM